MTKSQMQDEIDLLLKKLEDQAVTNLNLIKSNLLLAEKLSAVKSLSVDMCVLLKED